MSDIKIVTLTQPQSPAAEAYRALRMNLAFASVDKELESLVVASPAPNEMKSLVAANLAVVMAQAEKQVVLVDGDLRRPHVHQLFDVAQEPGVTTLLLHQGEMADLPLLATSVPGLRVLPSGTLPPNPADVLNSRKMEQLLERLKDVADIVICDAPPVTVAVDAAVLAARTDGLLFVVRAGHTRRDRIEQAKEMLERFRVRLLGAVFTNAPEGGLLTAY